MKTLRIYPTSVNDRFVCEAADILRNGGVIVYPTDTLYAIGCDALRQGAIERVCALKGLSQQKNTLSIVCDSISQASEYAGIDNKAFAILRRFTPGPYTFILPSAPTLPKAFKGRRSVGVRIPDNAIARALASELGNPLLTTSVPAAWLDSGEITLAEAIASRMAGKGIDLMIDGGDGGEEPSTVVNLADSSAPELIRQGAGKWDV